MAVRMGRSFARAKLVKAQSHTVHVRYGTLKRIQASTAANYYSGTCGPLSDVKTMAAVAASCGRMDIVESILSQIRAVAMHNTRSVADLIHDAQRADIREDAAEENFREHPSSKTWRPWSKAMREHMALEQEKIAAGDEEYRA